MQDPAPKLRRTPLLGTWVNKGKKRKGRGCSTPRPLSEDLQMTRKTTLAMSPALHPQVLALQQPTTRRTVLDLLGVSLARF
jgi:hypothetical protein